ncbi:SNF2 family N-terminal domain-containing protein [Phyllosticta capitalensis]
MPARGRKRTRKADDSESTLATPLTTWNKKRGRPAGVKNGQGKGEKKAPAKGRSKKANAVPRNRLLDTASLLTSDPIRDANANENEPATYVDPSAQEGNQGTRRKNEALNRMLATVPLDQKKTAELDKKDLLEATKHFAGHGACRADGKGGWLVGGMKTALKHYQVLGAGFMRQRERGVDEPRGGLCSDSMGFGKTVMTLANIVNDHVWCRRVRDEGPKTTLIVVPSSLVTQWRSEIDKHVRVKDIKMKIMVYRSGSRIDTNDSVNDLAGYDVIITTWNEVMRSFPKGDPPLELQTSQEKHEWWQNFFDENKGLLHKVKFRRVVLDEAQAIKNHKGRTSLACRQLIADFRWALSGTPIMNSPLELYAYFKFLHVPSTGTFRIFKANYYSNSDPKKLQRLEVMLQKFMIRRTHKDSLFGAPILKLPKTDESLLECEFNDTERAIYDIVRKRMIARINSFSRDNALQRNYSNILVMLLRLRQMTGNVLLVETVMRDLLEREDHEKLAQLANIEVMQDEQREAQIVALRRMLAENTNEDPEESSPSSQNGVNQLPDQDEDVNTGRGHGLQYNFSKYLCSLRKGKAWEELQARTLCSECRNTPHEPMVTSCYHLYCSQCLEAVQHRAALKGLERARCTTCQNEYSRSMPVDDYTLESVIQSQGMESDNEGPTDKHWKKKRRGKKGKDEEDVALSWIDMNGAVLPSAKTIAMKAQILNWLEAKPDGKIIIYTQFLGMIRILSKVCNQEGWGFVEYHGKMSLAQRDAAIDRFRDDKEAKILLASIKCGGIGLNLTMASHVAICDLWWNRAVEQQAFGRVLRIGQEENTAMTRFVVKGTIDEKLLAMQKRKLKQIDAVMGDANSNKKLTMTELLQLFGQVEEDSQGKQFIVVENKHTVPRFNQDSEDEGDED